MNVERYWMQPFSMNIDNDTDFIFPSRGLKLIGVRFYTYDGGNGEAERKAHCIQKSLYGSSKWFYFNKGFRIIEDKDEIAEIEVDEDAFDSNFLLYSDTEHDGINIGISAIVGANGTGKSTLIDTIVRLINNMSAAIIGEDFVYTSAQHLHYIDNVYASLAVYRLTRQSPWQGLTKHQRYSIEKERNVPYPTQLASKSFQLGIERFCRCVGSA